MTGHKILAPYLWHLSQTQISRKKIPDLFWSHLSINFIFLFFRLVSRKFSHFWQVVICEFSLVKLQIQSFSLFLFLQQCTWIKTTCRIKMKNFLGNIKTLEMLKNYIWNYFIIFFIVVLGDYNKNLTFLKGDSASRLRHLLRKKDKD